MLLLATTGCQQGNAGGHLQPGTPKAEPQNTSGEDVWAIRCISLPGPNRHRVAKGYADALHAVDGLKGNLVQVFDESGESVIYYGRYRRDYNAQTGQESYRPDNMRDLELIRSLSMTMSDPTLGTRNVWPFQLATMDTLPTSRGGHPDWELAHASGYYSLQVAVFYDEGEMRQRRYAAEEYCRILREQGEEAYYNHGRVNSIVAIGAFPKDVIRPYRHVDPLTGLERIGERMVDERLLALQRKYPHNLHNGAVFYELSTDPLTGNPRREAHTSFAVIIPGADVVGPSDRW